MTKLPELLVDNIGHYYIGFQSVSKEDFETEERRRTLIRIEEKLDKLIKHYTKPEKDPRGVRGVDFDEYSIR